MIYFLNLTYLKFRLHDINIVNGSISDIMHSTIPFTRGSVFNHHYSSVPTCSYFPPQPMSKSPLNKDE